MEIMAEEERAWRKGREENLKSAEIGGFGRQTGAGLFTSFVARHPSSELRSATFSHKGRRGSAASSPLQITDVEDWWKQ
jgi:hypothetical protein